MDVEHKPDPGTPLLTTGYTGILDVLETALPECAARNRSLGIAILDLSRIETLNPLHGYRKTSQLLEAIQEKLKTIMRPADILARIDYYNYALVIPDLKFSAMIELAVNKITEAINTLRIEHGIDTAIYPKTGIAIYPDHGETAEDLLLGADTAAQASTPGVLALVESGSNQQRARQLSKTLDAELESAFRQSRLDLYYQPKVQLGTKAVYGAEALLRWNHENFGFINPEILMPVIESSHLLQDITLWILNTALHQARAMREQNPDFRIAVNLSPGLLGSNDLVELILRALRIWDTNPEHLILEVTETSIMVNEETARDNLHRLHAEGIQISIDDFGNGYSSYSYLQKLPVQELKIDKSFILDLMETETNERLVKSMIHLGKDFGIKILAEGIESEAVMQKLTEMGCEYAQCFLIAKPMPFSEMMHWLAGQQH